MNYKSIKTWLPATIQIGVSTLAISIPLLVACGGKISPGDMNTSAAGAVPFEVTGTENFLVFPNPLIGFSNPISSPAIDSAEWAQTYYQTIDPLNERDTLEHWKAKNGFGNLSTGQEIQTVFGDVRDLGYGRYMTARWGNDDTWAFMVDNYSVAPTANYAYTTANVEAAVAQDKQWFGGTNAIEISPGPNCTTPLPNALPECKYITKFYNFNPTTGERQLAVNLDGLGLKAMPGVCLACHGGRADEILPASKDASGNIVAATLPNYFANPASGVAGNVMGKLHFFEVDTFDFSTKPGYTRQDQEVNLKTLNQWVLCTYPLAASATGPEDSCRYKADSYEWQSPAAEIVKAAYGGDGMPNSTYSDTFVPTGWESVGQSTLYNNVVKPACRVCHILRGEGKESNISFNTYANFEAFADKIHDHVINRGNMPLSRIVSDRYWASPSMYQTLDQFLTTSHTVNGSAVQFTVTDSNGAQLKPGRPIADFGPSRIIGAATQPVSTTLSAQWSLFSDTFSWSIIANPGNAANLRSTTGAQTTFTATADGTYVVQLISSKGSAHSDPVQQKIVVHTPTAVGGLGWNQFISGVPATSSAAITAKQDNPTTNPYPGSIYFSDIKAVLQTHCTSCHSPTAKAPFVPPIFYTSIDRNGDNQVQSGVGEADDLLHYHQVLSFVNLKDISNSQLLRHPLGYSHGGGIQYSFGSAVTGSSSSSSTSNKSGDLFDPGNIVRDGYDMFINWILDGAPYSQPDRSGSGL